MWPIKKPQRKHVIAFVVFVILMQVLLYSLTLISEDYGEARRFVLQDIRLASSIGKVQK